MEDNRYYIIKVNGKIRGIVSIFDYAPFLKELLQEPYCCKISIEINEVLSEDLEQGKITTIY